jgi:hypothetical protein
LAVKEITAYRIAGKRNKKMDEMPWSHFIVETISGFARSMFSISFRGTPCPIKTANIRTDESTKAPPNKPRKIPNWDHGEDTRK